MRDYSICFFNVFKIQLCIEKCLCIVESIENAGKHKAENKNDPEFYHQNIGNVLVCPSTFL